MHVTLGLASLFFFLCSGLPWITRPINIQVSMENEKAQLFLSLEKGLVMPEDLHTTWQQGKIGHIPYRKAQAEKAINVN